MGTNRSIYVGLGIVVVVACKAAGDKAAPDASTNTTTTASVTATASAAPSAPVSAAVKHPSANQPAPKGCQPGWTRTTKGICVDWCETTDDCDEPKTCQDSPHVDPDLGKIKTCQTPKKGTAGCPPSQIPTGPEADAPCIPACLDASSCKSGQVCTPISYDDPKLGRVSAMGCAALPNAAPAGANGPVAPANKDFVEGGEGVPCPTGWIGMPGEVCDRPCKTKADCKEAKNDCQKLGDQHFCDDNKWE